VQLHEKGEVEYLFLSVCGMSAIKKTTRTCYLCLENRHYLCDVYNTFAMWW